MTESFLEKLFEHNNWANEKMVDACLTLSDGQLDAEPQSATKGTIRGTLMHLVSSQQSYLQTLTRPIEERRDRVTVPFNELPESIIKSGTGLLALAKGEHKPLKDQLETRDGFLVEAWVLMVQIINHATEHREQINSMMSALGLTPLDLDGWSFAEASNAINPMSK